MLDAILVASLPVAIAAFGLFSLWALTVRLS